MKRMPVILAYLGSDETENGRNLIKQYVKPENAGQIVFVKEDTAVKNWRDRKICSLMEKMGIDDLFLVPGLPYLGNSITEVLEIMAAFRQKSVNFYSIKEDFPINIDVPEDFFLKILRAFTHLQKNFSITHGEAERKRAGRKIGRPRGPGKSKLDKHRKEITALLKNGSTKSFIAKRYNTTLPNLYNWLKQNRIHIKHDDV